MARTDDIRSALAQSGEPMFPREICDALGIEDATERKNASASVAAMASNGAGIERMDDGRYSLIPGWKNSRGAEKPAAPPVPDGEPDTVADARLRLTQAQADVTQAQVKAMLPPSAEIEVPPAGTSTGTAAAANKVAERILEYLRGEADYNLLQLLRDAREEIMQLDCATRLALSTAEDLAAKLRATTG